MLKRFCDICGKEISSDYKVYSLKMILQSTNYVILNYDDICEDCKIKIVMFKDTLKKEK